MKFYPSRAHRWVGGGCTGSVKAEAEAYRMPDSSIQNEGNRLHAIAAGRLLGTNTDTIDPEDWKQVYAYIRDVETTVTQQSGTLHVEERVPGGVIDARCSSPTHEIIWDYKSGFRTVEAVLNWQLIMYAIELKIPAHKTVELRIAQPNGYHPDGPIRSWTVGASLLAGYAEQIRCAREEASSNPQLVARPNNCTHCSAVTTCAAARGVTLGGMDLALKDTGKMDPAAIRTELITLRTASEMLKIRLVAMEAEAEARLRAGGSVPGCGMRAGKAGALDWTADESRIRTTLQTMGIEPAKSKLITPKQAIDAGVPAQLVGKLAQRKPSKMAVVTDVAEQLAKQFST